MPDSPIRILVAANFIAEPLREPLEYLLGLLRIPAELEIFHDPIFQAVLDPQGRLAANARGLNVLVVNPAGAAWDLEFASDLARRIEDARTGYKVPLLVLSAPAATPEGEWFAGTAVETGVQVYADADKRDGDLPFTRPFLAAIALRIARAVRLHLVSAAKVIAADCDNTLWDGVCGEDGPEGVKLDEGRGALQRFLLAQREQGKLICLASKNNEEDVWDTFAAHPEFPLRREHCVSWRINWDPKSENLASLAEELNLGVDSFVLIDDDRRECGEVSTNLPDVTVLRLPKNPADIPQWLEHLWIFDQLTVTEEDRRRNQFYLETSARARLERQAANFEDFIAGLELQIRIEPLTAAAGLTRAAQLTQRTNQMNLSTVRRSESELESLLRSPGIEGRVVSVADRFGDYGIVGLLICDCSAGGPVAVVDTLLLSCRAMGRGVEYAMLREAASIAAERGMADVWIRYAPTRKNAPAKALLESVKGAKVAEGGYAIAAADLAKAAFAPGAIRVAPSSPGSSGGESAKAHAPIPHGDYAAIADLRGDPELLLVAVENAKARPNFVMPEEANAAERKLALIWAILLKIDRVDLDADFFDLGGHSLLAVQLLSRIRDTFHCDLSLDLIYSGQLTVRRLAAILANGGAIPEAGSGAAGVSEEEYASLLAEVENLSEEELQALLGEDQ